MDKGSNIAREIVVEAETIEEARGKLKRQVPEGLRIVSETTISDGKPRTITAFGDTTDSALAKCKAQIPSGARIIEVHEPVKPDKKIVVIDEYDADSAKSKVEETLEQRASIESVELKRRGTKGFLGFGKTPHSYEVRIEERAVARITIDEHAKIRARIGEKPKCQRCGKLADSLTEVRIVAADTGRALDLDVCTECFVDAVNIEGSTFYPFGTA